MQNYKSFTCKIIFYMQDQNVVKYIKNFTCNIIRFLHIRFSDFYILKFTVMFLQFTCIKMHLQFRERGGVVVERRTLNREILGSIPTGVTVLCPSARHINSLHY